MADMKGVWSLAEVKNKKGVVTSKTATYKIDNKAAAEVAGLSPSTTQESDGSIDGITVNDTDLKVRLSKTVLGTSNVTLTQKNSYKYTLELSAAVPGVEMQNPVLSYASGKATVKGDLTEGYTLNAKGTTVTYSAAKEKQPLATVSNLSTALKTAEDGTIYAESGSESAANGGEEGETETFTPAIQLGTGENAGKILVTRDALTNKSATLKLDYANSGYQLAFDGEASAFAPEIEGEWTAVSKNKTTYKGKVTSAGYALSADGKTAAYFAENAAAKTLVTVSGVKSKDGIEFTENNDNVNYPFKITLSNDALTSKNVTVSGTGYQLALAQADEQEGTSGVPTEATTTNTWSMNKNTATYKTIESAYYTLADNKVTYHAPVDKKVLATVSGVNSNLVADGDKLVTKATTANPEPAEAITVNGTTFTVEAGALNKAKVTLTDKSEGGYKLVLGTEGIGAPGIKDGTLAWKRSGTTATLTGRIESAGYAQPDSNTITYAGATSKAATLATIKGLAKGIVTATPEDGEYAVVGTNETVDGENQFVQGIEQTGETFTLSKNVLGNTNVTLTSSAGFNYKLAIDTNAENNVKNEDDGTVAVVRAVPTSATNRTFWDKTVSTVLLKNGKEAYYTATDNNTISYTAPVPGNTIQTITGLETTLKINDDASEINGITIDSDQLKLLLSKNALAKKTVDIKGSGGYTLALADESLKPQDTVGWTIDNNVAYLKGYKSAGYTAASNGLSVTYSTRKEDGSKGNLAIVSGLKKGLTVKSDGSISGIEIGNMVESTGEGESGRVSVTGNSEEEETSQVFKSTDYLPGTVIQFEKKVLTTTDVTLNEDSAYKFALSFNASEDTTKWAAKKGSATYTITTPAGYRLDNDATTVSYKKKSSVTATISGLNGTPTTTKDSETNKVIGVEGLSFVEGSTTAIQIDPDLIASGKTAKISGGNYTLAVSEDDVATADLNTNSWTIDKKKGTAAYKIGMSEGLDLAADGKSVTHYSGENTTKTLFTVSGLNTTALKNNVTYTEGTSNTEELGGFSFNTETNTVDLGEGARSFITKKATVNNGYTFALADSLAPTAYSKPKWFVSTVKSTTTATRKNGTEAGYTLSNEGKTVNYNAETPGDAVFTITGLKKGLAVSSDRQSIGIKDRNGTVTNAITVGTSTVSLADPAILGTSDIVLTGTGYTFESNPDIAPGDEYESWTFSNGTATYAEKQDAGFTLSSDSKVFSYTKAASLTLVTVKGLNKNYAGADLNDVSAPISINKNNVIELGADLVGTSKITVGVPKGSTTSYTLDLATGIAQQANQKTGWVTSGTAASYKDYNDAYYTIASNGKTITYNKPKDIKVYATVKGIKSGATVTDTNKVITLDKSQLANTKVTLSVGEKNGYSLALAENVIKEKQTDATDPEWVISGTTATYKSYIPGYYTLNAKGTVATYNKSVKNDVVGTYATIKGVSTDEFTATLDENVFTVSGTQLNSKVTVSGGENSGEDTGYGFNFKAYNNATIVGSAKGDNITANGTGLYISVDKGNDSVTATGSGVTVIGNAGADTVTASGEGSIIDLGAGDDVVTVSGNNSSVSGGAGKDTIIVGVDDSGTGISVNAGAGDDSINASESKGGNVFIFAKNQGTDVITGFSATDSIQTTSGTPVVDFDSGSAVIKLGSGTITVEDVSTITVNGKEYSAAADEEEGGERSANILLADDNYATDAAQLSSIVQPFAATYTPYDFNSGLGLTKEDYTPEISFAKDDK